MRGLVDHWVYGGFLSGLLLLAILPVMAWGWDPALALIFFQLPVYMIHQFEEHHGDRFREYVNRLFGGEVLFISLGIVNPHNFVDPKNL